MSFHLERYFISALGKNFLSLLVILLVISVASKANDILSSFISRDLPIDFLFSVLWSFIPETILVVFGLSLFISVILTLTTLNSHSEMPILYSCGLSKGFLLKCVAWFCLPLVPLMLWVSLVYSPTIKVDGKKAFIASQTSINLILQPNDLQSFGASMMYAQKQLDEHTMQGFYARYLNDKKPLFISAHKATSFTKDGLPWLRLEDGFQWTDDNDETLQVLRFEQFEIAVPNLTPQPDQFEVQGVAFEPIEELFIDNQNPQKRTEIHWRFSYVISAVLMAFFAVFLVPFQPRSSRFTYVALGLLIFVIFATSLTTLKNLSSKDIIPSDVAFGGIYLALILLTSFAWLRHEKII